MVNYNYAAMNQEDLIALANNLVTEYQETKNNPYSRVKLQDFQKLEKNLQRARHYSDQGQEVYSKVTNILREDARIKPKESKTLPTEYEIRQNLAKQGIHPTSLNRRV